MNNIESAINTPPNSTSSPVAGIKLIFNDFKL